MTRKLSRLIGVSTIASRRRSRDRGDRVGPCATSKSTVTRSPVNRRGSCSRCRTSATTRRRCRSRSRCRRTLDLTDVVPDEVEGWTITTTTTRRRRHRRHHHVGRDGSRSRRRGFRRAAGRGRPASRRRVPDVPDRPDLRRRRDRALDRAGATPANPSPSSPSRRSRSRLPHPTTRPRRARPRLRRSQPRRSRPRRRPPSRRRATTDAVVALTATADSTPTLPPSRRRPRSAHRRRRSRADDDDGSPVWPWVVGGSHRLRRRSRRRRRDRSHGGAHPADTACIAARSDGFVRRRDHRRGRARPGATCASPMPSCSSSDPPAGAQLAVAPAAVTLRFNESVTFIADSDPPHRRHRCPGRRRRRAQSIPTVTRPRRPRCRPSSTVATSWRGTSCRPTGTRRAVRSRSWSAAAWRPTHRSWRGLRSMAAASRPGWCSRCCAASATSA